MNDRILIELAPGWAIGADNLQWMLMRAKIRRGQRDWTPVAFIASEKRILRRVLRENGVEPTPEAARYLDALPPTFKQWCRKQKGQKAKSAILHLNWAAE